MAVAFRVSHPDDFARMFAAHDEYSSIVNELFGRVLTPRDEFYTAPFCFMPEGEFGGFVVFTTRVPWPHGNGCFPGSGSGSGSNGNNNNNNNNKRGDASWRRQHFERAKRVMRERGGEWEDEPWTDMGVERMQDQLALEEEDIYTFTRDGCYPDEEDISRALEDRAVKVTCDALGWKMPKDWREEREKERSIRYVGEVFDLSEHDDHGNDKSELGDNKRMKYSIDPSATLISREGVDQEEKKDERNGQPQMNHSVDPGAAATSSRDGDEHEDKIKPLHDWLRSQTGQGDEHPVHAFDDDTNRKVEDEGRCPSLGHEYVGDEYDDKQDPQQHVDSFYGEDANGLDEDEEAQMVHI